MKKQNLIVSILFTLTIIFGLYSYMENGMTQVTIKTSMGDIHLE